MKSIKVVTQGDFVFVRERFFIFFWRPVFGFQFDPDASGSHRVALDAAFKTAGKYFNSKKAKSKVEMEL